uniref:CASPASE_P20 domain-containing protein n=1 Tax=Macrostomum lignano TaxID=282301 RepID=A0A1I8G028_9PLAT
MADSSDAAVRPKNEKKRRTERGRSGGFLSIFGCASSKSSSPPPIAKSEQRTKQIAAPPAVNHNSTAAPAAAAAAHSSAGAKEAATVSDQSFDPKHVYNMRHRSRGLALIFNFQQFLPETNLSYRHGSDKDLNNVVASFKRLQFQVHKFSNLYAVEFLSQLKQVSEVNHSDHDAIAIVIMSHGEEGVIFASDGGIPLVEVFEPIRQCPSLTDSGVEETEPEAFRRALDAADGIKTIQRLPTDADFLICYSVVPGYFSWRNGTHGSWFVQKLTEVLAETDCSKVEFMRVMTRVNRAVAYEFESHTNNPHLDRKKQVPSIVSMLTKELYFPSK